MSDKTTLFLVDDHKLLLDGIVSMIGESPQWEVIGMANDGEEALRKIPILLPEMVLMDLDMPKMNGMRASEELLKILPNLKIVILTLHYEKSILQQLIKTGVSGYILKNTPRDEFLLGLNMIRSGSHFYSSVLTESMLEVSPLEVRKETNVKLYALLSERERAVLQLVAEGLPTKEIADVLNLSPKTIETYRKSLLSKLNCRNSADLIRTAIKEGFIDL